MFKHNRACERFPYLVQSGDALEAAPLLDIGDDECDRLPEALSTDRRSKPPSSGFIRSWAARFLKKGKGPSA